MRTKRTLIIPLLLLVQLCWGQEEIEINPFGKDKPITKVKIGNTVKFKVSNVNTFMISGDTESEPLHIDFEIPDIFKNFIEPPKDETEEQHSIGVEDNDEKINKILLEIEYANKSHNKELVNQLLENLKNITNEEFERKKGNFIAAFSSFITDYNTLHQQIEQEHKQLEKLKDSVFIKDTTVLKNNDREYYVAVYGTDSTEVAKRNTEAKLNNLMVKYSSLQQLYDELNKTLEKDSIVLSGELKSADKKTTVKIEKA